MSTYDEAVAYANTICDTDCWETPKTSCPFYPICSMRLNGDTAADRTEQFEFAFAAKFDELKEKGALA